MRLCKVYNLSHNVNKTKKLNVDLKRLCIHLAQQLPVKSKQHKIWGVCITDNISFTLKTTNLAKNAQQMMPFVRKLKGMKIPSFYEHHDRLLLLVRQLKCD